MSKLANVLAGLKRAAPYVKGAVVLVGNELSTKEYKHKEKVEKALNGAYKAADAVERIL